MASRVLPGAAGLSAAATFLEDHRQANGACPGATERPIVFGGNDKPGVMMASAVRTYLNRFAITPGQRAVLFTAADGGHKTRSI
jgi:hypothetical protein